VAVFREGDPHDAEGNERQSIDDMAAVADALYQDRTLNTTCELLTIQQMDTLSLENASGDTETVGALSVELLKQANQPPR
jgi:hypothetical protein